MPLIDRPHFDDRRTPRGVWRGTVTRLHASGRPYVEIRRLVPGYEYGPLEVLQGPWTIGLATDGVGDHTHGGGTPDGAHSHGVGPDLAAGDRVLVAFVEGRPDEPVVLGRLA